MLELDIPVSAFDKAELLHNLLVSRSTGGEADPETYQRLRAYFLRDDTLKSIVPSFVRSCRGLDQFWHFIRDAFSHYAQRRQYLWEEFAPLLDFLEHRNESPSDEDASDLLKTFDGQSAHAAWVKALSRIQTDPSGAITAARTLLETVCKVILKRANDPFDDASDLPKLYHRAAEFLAVSPRQETEVLFKTMMGNCQSIAGCLAGVRNRAGDAHGYASPIEVEPRHARLVVTLAGALAVFLIESSNTQQLVGTPDSEDELPF